MGGQGGDCVWVAGIVASKWSGDGMPDGGEAQGYQLGITFVCNN